MKTEPFVSIVICTHNRERSLEKYAFKSILELDYSNYEVIIVDDASTDNTEELVNAYKGKIKNLRYIKNKKMQGLCYVRNLGVKHSKGDIIAFIDDDCYVYKDWLSELVKPYIEDKKTMVVGGDYIQDEIPDEKAIHGCNMSFKREIFDKFLFDTNIYFNKCSWCDETELISRIKNKNFKIAFSDKAIVNHFIHPSSYRSRYLVGGPLNHIYSKTKKISLIRYYILLLFSPLFSIKKNKYGDIRDELQKINRRVIFSFIAFFDPKYLSILVHIPYIYYSLLITIPIKAKIKNWLDEKIFREGNQNNHQNT